MSDKLREAARALLAALESKDNCVPMRVSKHIVPAISTLRAALAAESERVSVLINCERFALAPCYLCGYNGAGYYQPDMHPCAKLFHAAAEKESR